MKANKKLREDDAVTNVVSTLMLLAIVVPLMALIIISFSNMALKQIEMMETTSDIIEDSLIRLEETMGRHIRSGDGWLFESNYSIRTIDYDGSIAWNNYTCYLIAHLHEIPDTEGKYAGIKNCSGYYPVMKLPDEFTDNVSHNKSLDIKFKVDIIETYFDFVFPDAYAIRNDTGKIDYITSEIPHPGVNYTIVPINMARVMEIEKKI